MKVIFLDIDGVLNNQNWTSAMWEEYHVDVCSKFVLYQPAVALLKRIIDCTGAMIVITSSWRKIPRAFEALNIQLAMWDINIYDVTPYVGGVRGDDIQAWLDKHQGEVEQFVILDDDDDMNDLSEHLVQTSFSLGLTEHDVLKCISLLEVNNEDN